MSKSNWVPDPAKFMTREEVRKLLQTAKERAEGAMARGRKVAVRDCFIVDLAMPALPQACFGPQSRNMATRA
jgi:hypothetical protein